MYVHERAYILQPTIVERTGFYCGIILKVDVTFSVMWAYNVTMTALVIKE